MLRPVEIGGRIASQVGVSERSRVGEGQVHVAFLLEADRQICAATVEHVPAHRSVVAEEVQVVARDLDPGRIRRRPEPDHRAAHRAQLELRLRLGRDRERHARSGSTRRTHVHRVEPAVDSHREKQVRRLAQAVEHAGQRGEAVDVHDVHRWRIAEPGDHRERRPQVVVDFTDLAIGTDPEHVTFEHDHLAVEILERAQSEVAVLADDADRHRPLVHTFHQRTRSRHLVERVVLDSEELGQRALDEMIDRSAAAATACSWSRVEDRRVDAGTQLRHAGNVAAEKFRVAGNRRADGARLTFPNDPLRREEAMRRVAGVAVLVLALLIVVAAPAGACGGLVGENGTIQLTRTTTLAAWHDGIERYVTSFEFSGAGEEVGSIVPLPAVPIKVERGGDWTLQRLRREIPTPAFEAQASRLGRALDKAEVLQQTTVDALDITILRGGGDAVGKWAIDHGFLLTPDAPEVLDFYSERSQIFMAARFNAARAARLGQQSGDGTPIMLTIPIDAPWVPLRILALGLDQTTAIDADVFLLTDERPTVLTADRGVQVAASNPAPTAAAR